MERMGIKNDVFVKHGCPYHLECSENLIWSWKICEAEASFFLQVSLQDFHSPLSQQMVSKNLQWIWKKNRSVEDYFGLSPIFLPLYSLK